MRTWIAGCLLALLVVAAPRFAEAVVQSFHQRDLVEQDAAIDRARSRAQRASAEQREASARAYDALRARSGIGERLAGVLSRLSGLAVGAGFEKVTLTVAAAVPHPHGAPRLEERTVLLAGAATLDALRKLVEELDHQPLPVRIEAIRWDGEPDADGRLRITLGALVRSGASS